jgi:hypothetical protein
MCTSEQTSLKQATVAEGKGQQLLKVAVHIQGIGFEIKQEARSERRRLGVEREPSKWRPNKKDSKRNERRTQDAPDSQLGEEAEQGIFYREKR